MRRPPRRKPISRERPESTSTGAVGKNRLYRDGMVVYFQKHGTGVERVLARTLRRLPI